MSILMRSIVEYLHQSATTYEFVDGSSRLIDRFVHEGPGARVAIRDRNSSERPTAQDMRTLLVGHVGIAEAVICVRVPVRPTVDGDAEDVGRWIESAWSKNARQLPSRFELHLFPGRL